MDFDNVKTGGGKVTENVSHVSCILATRRRRKELVLEMLATRKWLSFCPLDQNE